MRVLHDYEQFLKSKQREYGSRFDASNLDLRFVSAFNSGARIKVDFVGLDEFGKDCYGHTVLTGTVGITTGWKPVFLLMRTSRSTGSSETLGPRDKIVAVKRGAKYIACAA